MVVAMSREICVHLYDAIVALRPDWHDPDPEQGAIKIVMTGSASDKQLLRPPYPSGQGQEAAGGALQRPCRPAQAGDRSRHVADRLRCPLHAQPLRRQTDEGHNLMQAIARVNRVFRDKQGGLVVDYIGIANEPGGHQEYTSRGRAVTVDAHEAYAVLEEKLDVLRALLHGFDYGDYLTGGHKLLAGAANHVWGWRMAEALRRQRPWP